MHSFYHFGGETSFCFPDGRIFNGCFDTLKNNLGVMTFRDGSTVSGVMTNTRKTNAWTFEGLSCWKFTPNHTFTPLHPHQPELKRERIEEESAQVETEAKRPKSNKIIVVD